MNRLLVGDFLTHNGWEQDRWGHYRLTLPELPDGMGKRHYRVKLQVRAVRYEKLMVTMIPGIGLDKAWIRIGGEYYRSCVVTPGKGLRLKSIFIQGVMPTTHRRKY